MSESQQLSMDDIDAIDVSPNPDETPEVMQPVAEEKPAEIEAMEQRISTALATAPSPDGVAFVDVVANLDQYWRMARALAHGKPEKETAEMFQKMTIGASLGISPGLAAKEIHVINGSFSLSCHIIAGALRRTGWELLIEESDPVGEWCQVTAKREGSNPVSFKYTLDMAKQQGLVKGGGGWEKHPWNMLYARAVSIVGKRAEPMMLMGFYTPEELHVADDNRPTDAPRGARARLRRGSTDAADEG